MSELWKKIINLLAATILATGVTAGLSGCEREGPGERAGEAVDEAAKDVGEAAEEAGDEL